MRKTLSIVLALALVFGLMVPCTFAKGNTGTNCSIITVKTVIDVDESIGANVKLDDDLEQEGYSINTDTLRWYSNNDRVATVHGTSGTTEAMIYGYSVGSTTICCYGTATAMKSGGTGASAYLDEISFNGELSITVESGSGRGTLESVTICQGSTTMNKGYSERVYASVSGVEESYVDFEWSSTDTNVLTVKGSGATAMVYARSAGRAQVAVEARYGSDVKYDSYYVTVEDSYEVSEPTIRTNLPSSRTVDYGENYYLEVYAVADKGTVYYDWYVDGSYKTTNYSGEYNTRNLSSGRHYVFCKAYAVYAGSESSKVTSNTCTVYVGSDTPETPTISSDLPSSRTVSYGASYTIGITARTSYGTLYYEWYVDGKRDYTSSTNSFNTRYLAVGTHSIYCNVYAKNSSGTSKTVSSNTCEVTVQTNESAGSMSNFRQIHTYNNNFYDVKVTDWFYQPVRSAYQYGLIDGNGDGRFLPNDYFTIAQALKVAASIHSTYYNGSVNINTTGYSTWYTPYVEYCINNGIISYGDFPSYTVNCTKSQMAYIFSRCLPANEIAAVRSVTIPDCNSYTPYYSSIVALYNAGVINGDQNHKFYPGNLIKRCEVATIINSLVNPSARSTVVF